MAPSFHELQLNLFITRLTTWLCALSIVVVVASVVESIQDFSTVNSSMSSLELITNESNLIDWKTRSSFQLRTKHRRLPASADNLTTVFESSWELPDNSHHSYSFLLRKRSKKMKMKTTTTTMMMMITRRTKRSNNEAVVNLKSQLYSVCSRKFVQIQGTQVNALADPESPLARLEIISEPRPTSVNFELTSFQRRHSTSDQRRRRRRRRYSDDQDIISFYVKIRSSVSLRYICFNKIGNIISKISGQNPKCRMTEVSHNGALYYYSAVNSSWFLQFNHRGHRIKNSDNSTHDGLVVHVDLLQNISELSLTPTNTSNCSDCSSASTPSSLSLPSPSSLLSSSPSSSSSSSSSSSLSSSSSSSSSPSSTSTTITLPPSPSPPTSDDSSSVTSSDHRRRIRRYPKYSKCQGFIKIPLASSTSPPSLNFKSVK